MTKQLRAMPEQLREATNRLRVRCEIYPDMKMRGPLEAVNWFELALHAELEEYRPQQHPASLDARFVLGGLADYLVSRSRTLTACNVTRSEMNTLHPGEDGKQAGVRISRTLSLVFTDIGHYSARKEPGVLTHLKGELNLLGVAC